MKEELFVIIDGERKQLDLNTPSGIALNYKNNMFGDLSKIEDNYSYDFILPETATNRRILESKNSSEHQITIAAEFFINGVRILKDSILYVKKHETAEGFSVFLRSTTIDKLNNLRDKDISIRDLGGTDYIKDDFGTEEADDIIYNASCYNWFHGREPAPAFENWFVKVTEDVAFPPSYSKQAENKYYRLLYGAGVTLRKDGMGNVIAEINGAVRGREVRTKVTPFYRFDNKLLVPPPVASIPYLISKIAEYFGINISSDSVGLEKFCLPFSKMGQTECLMRQNYITLPIKGNVEDINVRYNPNDSSTWWWAFSKDSHYWFPLYLQKVLDFKAKNAIPQKAIEGFWIDNSGTGYVWQYGFVLRGGMGKNTYLRGCIKIKYRILDVEAKSSMDILNRIPQLKVKSSLFSFSTALLSLANQLKISFDRDTEDENAKEVSVDGDILDSQVTGVGNSSSMKFSGTFTVVYEMRPEYGGDLVSINEDFWGDKALFLYADSNSYNFAIESVDSIDLAVYTGDTELLSECANTKTGCMNFYKNLPDITCVELLNNLSFASGSFLHFDYATNTLKFIRRNTIMERDAVNWNDKIVFDRDFNEKKLEYDSSTITGEVGKTTYFLMKNDRIDDFGNPQKDEIDKDYYQHSFSKMLFSGDDLPENATYLSSIFSGHLISWAKARAFGSGDTIDFWKIKASTFDGSTSSLLDVEANEGGAFLGIFEQLLVKDYGKFGSVSIWHFPSDMNNSEEYKMLSRIWAAPYCIEEYMELSEFDLRDLDYTVPIYLDKYNAYFGIVDIERYDDGICKVTMFKLPMGKDYTIKYEPYITIMPKQGGYDYAWDDEVWVALTIKAYYYKQGEMEPFKSFNVDLAEDDIKVIFDHKYGDEEWYWDKERHMVVLTANPEAEQSYHVQMFFEVNIQGEVLDLSDKAVSYNRLYQQ